MPSGLRSPCERPLSCILLAMRLNRFEWPVIAAGAAIASLSLLGRRMFPRHHGPQTNASDAIDDVNLRANPSEEDLVDAGVKQTFPASDPVAVGKGETEHERSRSGRAPAAPEQAEKRSPDWMFGR